MTRYGPWVQPDDVEATPLNLWYMTTKESQGTVGANTDASAFASSVAAAVAGVGGVVVPDALIAGLVTAALEIMTQADKIELPGSQVAALARLALLAPSLGSLTYPPVPPDVIPETAVDYEYEDPEGVPVADTLRIYGFSVVFAASPSGSNQVGARMNRLFPGDYTLDGFGRPTSTWSAVRAGGSPVATFTPPVTTATWVTDEFELTGQSLDVNGYAVYSLVDLFLDSSWLLTEASTGQVRNTAPLIMPSPGTLPYFTQTYTPPRYRFVYEQDPPLRQFPRSDSLVGTGGVRQRSAGSRQASNRQGWNGAYLRAGWAAG